MAFEDFQLGFQQLTSQGTLEFESENIWESFKGEIALNSGTINQGNARQIKEINAQLIVDNGVFQKGSSGTFKFHGMQGKADFEGFLGSEPLKLSLEGRLDEDAAIFPRFIQEGLRSAFTKDPLIFTAAVTSRENDCLCEGKLQIAHDPSSDREEIKGGIILSGISFEGDALQFRYHDGWFQSDHLPLNRYVEPF